MPELPTFISPGPTAPPMQPQVNPLAMSQSGEALAQAGARVTGTLEDWNQKYADARRQMDATTAISGASAQLGQLEQKYSLMPDRDAAFAGFQKDAGYSVDEQSGEFQIQPGGVLQKTLDGISDPLVRAHVQDQITQEAIARGLETRHAAFLMEGSKARGDLDQLHAQYLNDAATAATPQMRAISIDKYTAAVAGAAQAGWIPPEEGPQRTIQFRSDLAKTDAYSFMRTAGEAAAQGRLSPLAIGDAIADPKNFQGLLPQEREALANEGIARGKMIVQVQSAAQAHQDAVAEKEHTAMQQANAVDLLSKIDSDKPPNIGDVYQLGRTGQLSETGVSMLREQLTKKDGGTNDLPTLSHLYQRIGAGDDIGDDVLTATTGGKLARSTAADLLKANASKGAAGDKAIDQANFATLKTSLGIGPDGSIFTVPGEATTRTNERLALSVDAQQEWTRRVRLGGEDSNAVLSDMLPRLRAAQRPPEGPLPRFGVVNSMDDVASVWAKTKAAHDAKQMSDSDFAAQADLLNAWRAHYAALGAMDAAARGVPPPKSAPAVVAPGAKPSRSEATPPASDTEFGGVR